MEPYRKQYPKSNTVERIILKVAPSDSPIFKETLVKYVRPQLIKGVPSVLNDLKIFYRESPDKAAVIGSVLEQMSACMEENMCLDKDD